MSSPVFGCAEVERFCDAYLDGEFAEGDAVELERHCAGCPACTGRVRFHAEFKSALRLSAPRPSVPPELRGRIQLALAGVPTPIEAARWKRTALRYVPAMAAVAVVGALAWTVQPFSPVVEDAISKHQRDLPIEVRGNPDVVRAWLSNKVPFAMRLPILPPQAVLRGARLANVRDHDAAYLVYDVGGARVSVMVFDPSNVPMATQRLRQVGHRNLYFDGERGYNVMVYRDRDIGYAFTSDLDEDRMVQLVSADASR